MSATCPLQSPIGIKLAETKTDSGSFSNVRYMFFRTAKITHRPQMLNSMLGFRLRSDKEQTFSAITNHIPTCVYSLSVLYIMYNSKMVIKTYGYSVKLYFIILDYILDKHIIYHYRFAMCATPMCPNATIRPNMPSMEHRIGGRVLRYRVA